MSLSVGQNGNKATQAQSVKPQKNQVGFNDQTV